MDTYGHELILDLRGCCAAGLNPHFFGINFIELLRRRYYLRGYFKSLCEAIEMEPTKLTFWDDLWCWPWNRQTELHTTGTSAVQFILTSNVTLHFLELTHNAYINIFSCKEFNEQIAESVTEAWFKPSSCRSKMIERT